MGGDKNDVLLKYCSVQCSFHFNGYTFKLESNNTKVTCQFDLQGHLTKKAGWSFRDMFCAGRVVEEDLKRTMKACGGAIQTSVNGMTDDVLGRCELFEEEQIGVERYMIFARRLGLF